MANVTWFKVLTDIFSDDKIKILQAMPEGDALLVMWFKVLSQAGKTNDGGYIYLKKNIPYTPAMFSTLFGKHQQLVELAMRTFTEFGMIDIDESGYVFVTNWEKHQSIDKLDKIKEQTRLRVQSHRENKRLELQQCNVTQPLQVTQGNATELDIELDKDIKHTVECEEVFESWYATYPKQGSVKKTAFESWKKLWREKKIDIVKLIDGTTNYINYQNYNQYKICGAQVFLNQQRWNDDWTIKKEYKFKQTNKQQPNLQIVDMSDEERKMFQDVSRKQAERNGVFFAINE